MPLELLPHTDESDDGRVRKGDRRRKALLDATLRVINRDGVGAVTQRAVATEAGLPPSAVLYYFPTVDDLLVATLKAVNDRCVEALQSVDRLADVIEEQRPFAVAEYELWLLAARRPDLRGEIDRWTDAVNDLAGRSIDDPVDRQVFAVLVDGLFIRAATQTVTREQVRRILARMVTRTTHRPEGMP